MMDLTDKSIGLPVKGIAFELLTVMSGFNKKRLAVPTIKAGQYTRMTHNNAGLINAVFFIKEFCR